VDGVEEGDDAKEAADAEVLEHGLDVVGGQEDDVVGLQDGVGLLAVANFFDVDLDDDALVSFGADQAQVAVRAFKPDAAAERGELQQGQRGGLILKAPST